MEENTEAFEQKLQDVLRGIGLNWNKLLKRLWDRGCTWDRADLMQWRRGGEIPWYYLFPHLEAITGMAREDWFGD